MAVLFFRLVTIVASLAGLGVLVVLVRRLMRAGSNEKETDERGDAVASNFFQPPSAVFSEADENESPSSEKGLAFDSEAPTPPTIPDIPLTPEERRRAQEYLQQSAENTPD